MMSYAPVLAKADSSPLIRVRDLRVRYGGSKASAIESMNLEIAPGEIVGILGESGSGKSTFALSLLGLLPAGANVQGEIFFQDPAQRTERPAENLFQLTAADWRAIRGARISMIFQEPGLSLSPVIRVGDQVGEILRAHQGGTRKSLKNEVRHILQRVQLKDTERVYDAYPHQLSGGQLHRVAIAQAIACRPALIIADEPTRSLDVAVQAEILEVLRDVNREAGSALLFITHNPALLAGFAHRAVVMYAGRVVEEGAVTRVYQCPLHPYTKALLRLMPSRSGHFEPDRGRLPAIPGSLEDRDRLSRSCVFLRRCSARTARCEQDSPAATAADSDHYVSCFHYGH